MQQMEKEIERILLEYCQSGTQIISYDINIMEDLGLNSMEWMTFLMDVEEQFHLEFSDTYFVSNDLTNLGNVISAVKVLLNCQDA